MATSVGNWGVMDFVYMVNVLYFRTTVGSRSTELIFREFQLLFSFITYVRFVFMGFFWWLWTIFFGLFLFWFFLFALLRLSGFSLSQPSQKVHWLWIVQRYILKSFLIDFMNFRQVLLDEAFQICEGILEVLERVGLFECLFDPIYDFLFL